MQVWSLALSEDVQWKGVDSLSCGSLWTSWTADQQLLRGHTHSYRRAGGWRATGNNHWDDARVDTLRSENSRMRLVSCLQTFIYQVSAMSRALFYGKWWIRQM